MTRPVQAENLLKRGLLQEEKSSSDEIGQFLNNAEDFMVGSKVAHVPAKVRYQNAYDAVFQIAMAALRNLDVRPTHKEGSRNIIIQSLAWSLGVASDDLRTFIQADRIRAEEICRAASLAIGKKELETLIDAASRLYDVARKKLAGKSG